MADDWEEVQRKIANGEIEPPEITNDMTLAQGAAVAREIYESYLSQGFSPGQCLYITLAIMQGNPGIPPSH